MTKPFHQISWDPEGKGTIRCCHTWPAEWLAHKPAQEFEKGKETWKEQDKG